MTAHSRRLTQSITINATPQKVWELITRIDAIVTWYDTWDDVETDSTDPFLREGASFRLTRRHRHPIMAECEVTELSPASRLQWIQTTAHTPTTTVTFELITRTDGEITELHQTRTWSEPGL